MESSPFALFSDSESVIDLEIATTGTVVAANAAAPPISMSRRVNLSMHLSMLLNKGLDFCASLCPRSVLHEEGQNGTIALNT
jgi:hypothetical protein